MDRRRAQHVEVKDITTANGVTAAYAKGNQPVIDPMDTDNRRATAAAWAEEIHHLTAALEGVYEIADAEMTPLESKFVVEASLAIMLRLRILLNIEGDPTCQ